MYVKKNIYIYLGKKLEYGERESEDILFIENKICVSDTSTQ